MRSYVNPQILNYPPVSSAETDFNPPKGKAMSPQEPPQYSAIGRRLTAVRSVFSDLDQKAWAERHGWQRGQYNSWERGVRRIPVEHAAKLADLYGQDLDFLYRGQLDGVSEAALKRLSGELF